MVDINSSRNFLVITADLCSTNAVVKPKESLNEFTWLFLRNQQLGKEIGKIWFEKADLGFREGDVDIQLSSRVSAS